MGLDSEGGMDAGEIGGRVPQGPDWVPWEIGVGHMWDGLGAMGWLPLALGGLDWVPQESDWMLWGIGVGPTGGLGWLPWGRR